MSEEKYPEQDKLKNIVGSNVRKLREAKGVNQRELADYLGIKTVQSISQLENGVFYPSVENLMKLSEYFDVTPNDILFKDFVSVDKGDSLYINSELSQLIFEMQEIEKIRVGINHARKKKNEDEERDGLERLIEVIFDDKNIDEYRDFAEKLYEARVLQLNRYISEQVHEIEREKQMNIFQKGIKKAVDFTDEVIDELGL